PGRRRQLVAFASVVTDPVIQNSAVLLSLLFFNLFLSCRADLVIFVTTFPDSKVPVLRVMLSPHALLTRSKITQWKQELDSVPFLLLCQTQSPWERPFSPTSPHQPPT
ncbi:hypothetical protein GOODEAATRI_023184, partial [Goodea atripinnis]